MSAARALHPPGGGTALLYALGTTGGSHWDWHYLASVIVNVLLLAACGWLYNNATGHRWPHRMDLPPPPPLPDGLPPVSRAHVAAVLAEWDEALDVLSSAIARAASGNTAQLAWSISFPCASGFSLAFRSSG